MHVITTLLGAHLQIIPLQLLRVDALTGSYWRPSMRFYATNSASVEAEVTEIEALGTASKLRGTPQTIVSYVVNSGTAAISNVSVNLNITGANAFSDTKIINSLCFRSYRNDYFQSLQSNCFRCKYHECFSLTV